MSYSNRLDIQSDAYSVPVARVKIGRQRLSAAQAVAADTNGLLETTALPAAAANYTTFAHEMPYARTVTAVCSATQTGNITITGTNIDGNAITETIALTSDTPVESTKAFKTVTIVRLPIKVGSETIIVGWGDKIGIPFMMQAASDRPFIEATLNGVIETTAPTLTADADELEKNLIDLNSNLNGTEVCIYYYM